MRIDEFKRVANHWLTRRDRFRILTIGFEFLSNLFPVICSKTVRSEISLIINPESEIAVEFTLNSVITKEMIFDGDLCW